MTSLESSFSKWDSLRFVIFLTKKFNIIKFNLKIKRQAIDVLSRRLNLSKRRRVNQTAGQTNITNNSATTKSIFFYNFDVNMLQKF